MLSQAFQQVKRAYECAFLTGDAVAQEITAQSGITFKRLNRLDYLHRPDGGPSEWLPSEGWWLHLPYHRGDEAKAWRHNPLLGFFALFTHESAPEAEPLFVPFVAVLGNKGLGEIDRYAARQLFLGGMGLDGELRGCRHENILSIESRGVEGEESLPLRLDATFFPLSALLTGELAPADIAAPLYSLLRNDQEECLATLPEASIFPRWLVD